MGGLKKDLPITYWTFLIGAIAIAGVPGLAGFFSKDEILWKTFEGGHTLLWVVGILTALLTATYMFRLVFLAFHGERRHAPAAHGARATRPMRSRASDARQTPRSPARRAAGDGDRAHRAGDRIGRRRLRRRAGGARRQQQDRALPGAELPGASAPRERVRPTRGEAARAPRQRSAVPPASEASAPHGAEGAAHESTELSLMAVSIALAFAGIGLAWFFFVKSPGSADGVAAAAGPLHTLLLNKYYVDELYDAVIVKPIVAISRGVLWKVVDAEVIDGAVNGAGSVVETGATWLRRFQTGSVRVYAASILLGVVLVLGYYVWRFGQMATF